MKIGFKIDNRQRYNTNVNKQYPFCLTFRYIEKHRVLAGSPTSTVVTDDGGKMRAETFGEAAKQRPGTCHQHSGTALASHGDDDNDGVGRDELLRHGTNE